MQQNDKDNEIPVPEARHNLAQREAEGETLGFSGIFHASRGATAEFRNNLFNAG